MQTDSFIQWINLPWSPPRVRCWWYPSYLRPSRLLIIWICGDGCPPSWGWFLTVMYQNQTHGCAQDHPWPWAGVLTYQSRYIPPRPFLPYVRSDLRSSIRGGGDGHLTRWMHVWIAHDMYIVWCLGNFEQSLWSGMVNKTVTLQKLNDKKSAQPCS